MKTNSKNLSNKIIYYSGIFLVFTCVSCKKLVEVNGPPTSTNSDLVYANDADATSVIADLYIRLSSSSVTNNSNLKSLSLFAGLSSDEVVINPGVSGSSYIAYYSNNLTPQTETNYWSDTYYNIYVTNAAIEGISKSSTLTPAIRTQLLGQAKFLRAFYYFYLINLYGDVPLNITTDHKENSIRPRTSKPVVYSQIVTDLKEAEASLDVDYKLANNTISQERIIPNKFAAAALLSRVYLYIGDYLSAEQEATKVIENTSVYSIVDPEKAFLKNSKETIWALQPVSNVSVTNTYEAIAFHSSISNTPDDFPVSLSSELVKKFSINDKRKSNWIDSVSENGVLSRYPKKYANNVLNSAVTEYSIILRVAEQFLIRSEARAMLGKLKGSNSAESDLNIVRKRAGLNGTVAESKQDFIAAILNERQLEFFTEWGHRWMDLKRLGMADLILGPLKGSNWQSSDQLYLIPQKEIDSNPGLRGQQNP